MKRTTLARMTTLCLSFLLSVCFAAYRSYAQTSVDGAVSGTISDTTGALVPNAKVVVKSVGTAATASVTAGDSGYFRAARLNPGEYIVTVEAVGFAPYTASHVVVEVGKITELAPRLGAAGGNATVDVSSDAPVMNNETSDFTTEFNPIALNSLPINGRHWTTFALNSPGVTGGNNQYGLASFRGMTDLANNFLVDGSDDNDSFDGVERGYTRVGYTTPEDAVLEFQVLVANVPAQYGRALGGGVNAVTRSGTNQLHDDAFWYYRDNDFGATNPFNTLAVPVPGGAAGSTQTIFIKPKDKRHQFGGTVNGPLIHDKLFFLYSFDQQLRNFPVLSTPTPQFLAAGNAAYNNCKVAGTSTTTDSISCAMARGVTTAQINSALAYINGQSGTAPRQGNQDINFLKFDYQINQKNRASVLYDRMRWNSPNGIQTNPVVRRGITSLGNDTVKVDSVIGNLDTLITSHITNEIRANYARTFDTETGDTPLANEPTTTAGGLPPMATISSNSGFTVGTPSYIPRAKFPDETEADFVDTVTWTHGKHTFTFGGEYRWAHDDIYDVDYEHGSFSYTKLADFFTDYARTIGGTAGCDLAAGSGDTGVGTLPCYSTLVQAFGHPESIFSTGDYAAYAQDDWKITPRLTLNLGVRYDYEQLPSPQIPNPVIPQTNQFPSDKNNVAPRIGLAYDLFGNGRTLVHAGFGLYYGRIINGTIYKALATTGTPSAQFQLSTASSATSPLYPNIISSATPPAVSNIVAFAGNYQAPVADEINLSVQQQLGWKTVLGAAYLSSLGKELPNFVDENIAPATTTKTYSFVGGPLNGDRWTVPVYSARLNPAYNALSIITSNVTSNYNALAITLDHRFYQGLQFSASYTWSKALDYGMNQSSGADTNDQTDPFTIRPDRGLSTNNIPYRFVGNLTFQPVFPIKNRYMALAANGWAIAPVWTIQTGIPYGYGLSGGTTVAGGASTYNGSGGSGGGSTQFVNFQAYPQYASTDVFNGSGARRNSLQQAYIEDLDLRLSRTFKITEKYKLMLAGEAFNLPNREQFTSYNTGAYSLSGTTASYTSTFGTPSAAGNTIYRERQIQFVARFDF